MKYVKGQSGNPKGKPKGCLSKSTVNARECLEIAFEGLGGVPAMIEWAQDPDNRVEFYRIWSKIIPQQVNHADSNGSNLPPTSINVIQKIDFSKLSNDEFEFARKLAERSEPLVVIDAPMNGNGNGNGNGHHA